MAITRLRQEQIKTSRSQNDSISSGEASLVTASTDNQYDLNAIRSQINRILSPNGGNWYDDIQTVDGFQRGVNDLSFDLNSIETKPILFNTQVLNSVTIGSSNNFSVLSVSGNQAPTEDAATATGEGAIVSVLGAGDFGSNKLDVITGNNALEPYNLVHIRDASTNDAITSGGQTVFGLLQAENGVVNGDFFNDTTDRVQISFVRNDGSNTFEACPVADIQGKSIVYQYATRKKFENVPEGAYLNSTFADHVAAAEVTLQNAADNQGVTPVSIPNTLNFDLDDTAVYRINDENSNVILAIENKTGAQANLVTISSKFTVQDEQLNLEKASFDTSNQSISIGDTTGAISSASSLSLLTSGASANVILDAGQNVEFSDSYIGSTSFTGNLKLASSTTDYSSYITNFGQASLLSALNTAYSSGSGSTLSRVDIQLTSDISVGSEVVPSSHTIINGSAPNWNNNTFADAQIFLYGNLQTRGANYDYTQGSTTASGGIDFEYDLYTGDTISVIYS